MTELLLTENSVIALIELCKHPEGIRNRDLNACCTSIQGVLPASNYISRLAPEYVDILSRVGNTLTYRINDQGEVLLKRHLDNPGERRYQALPGGSKEKKKKKPKAAALPPVVPLQEDPEDFMSEVAKAAMNDLYPAIERGRTLNKALHLIISTCVEVMDGDPGSNGDSDLDAENDGLLDYIEKVYTETMEAKV